MSNSTNPSDTVRYGLIGSGMMGVEHLENIAHLDGAVVTAVSDPVDERRAIGAATVTSFGGEAHRRCSPTTANSSTRAFAMPW